MMNLNIGSILRKKKVNGKWRYYYDVKDMLGYDERREAAQRVYEYEKLDNSRVTGPYHGKSFNSKAQADMYYQTLGVASYKATKALDAYFKTPLGKLDKMSYVIDAGRKKVSDLLSVLSDRIKPHSPEYKDAKFKSYRK